MKQEDKHFNEVLITLQRRYRKDELVADLSKRLNEANTEINRLSKEVYNLKAKLQLDKEQKEINKLARVEARKEELYILQIETNKQQRKKIKELMHTNSDLIYKLNTLISK